MVCQANELARRAVEAPRLKTAKSKPFTQKPHIKGWGFSFVKT